jgi:ribosomal 30S subunit maturation factor RimM
MWPRLALKGGTDRPTKKKKKKQPGPWLLHKVGKVLGAHGLLGECSVLCSYDFGSRRRDNGDTFRVGIDSGRVSIYVTMVTHSG